MEANKCESLKCVSIAKKAAQEHDFKKAIRFIEKSLRLYPSDVAKLLLSEYKETYLNSNEQVESIKKIKNARDYYEVMGVSKMASDIEIKRAYKKLALKYHPDKCKVPGTNEAFQRIAKAFDILGDEKKRKNYDFYGLDYFEPQNNGYKNSSDTHSNNNCYRANNFYDNNDDMSTEELFNLIFGQLLYKSSQSSTNRV